jgi:hypothetical protein
MVQRRYVGIVDPKAAFAALQPAHKALTAMKSQVRPLGPDYLILEAAQKAMITAAYHFTRDPYFFGGSGMPGGAAWAAEEDGGGGLTQV